MKKEKSCGGIIVNDRKVLFLYSKRLRMFTVPKGHIEPNESEYDCALREIGEETGLKVSQLSDYVGSMTYIHPLFKTIKTVVLFIFESRSRDVDLSLAETYEGDYEYSWLDYDEAILTARRTNQQDVILECLDELRNMGKI